MDAAGLNAPELVAKYGRRHTFASWLVQTGAELHEVSGALGHSSVAMTQRYAHLSKGATVAKLGGILTNMPPLRLCYLEPSDSTAEALYAITGAWSGKSAPWGI